MVNEVEIVRVLLADDQPKVRFGLRVLLEREPGFQVVGEATDADDLLTQVEALCSDLILLDWELPGLCAAQVQTMKVNGEQERLARLRALHPALKVIALSGQPEARQAALNAGADAFVSKGDPPERLLAALLYVLAGLI